MFITVLKILRISRVINMLLMYIYFLFPVPHCNLYKLFFVFYDICIYAKFLNLKAISTDRYVELSSSN